MRLATLLLVLAATSGMAVDKATPKEGAVVVRLVGDSPRGGEDDVYLRMMPGGTLVATDLHSIDDKGLAKLFSSKSQAYDIHLPVLVEDEAEMGDIEGR